MTASMLKVDNEAMIAIKFRISSKGDLTHMYFIFSKPETLGNKFKCIEYSENSVISP